MTVRQQSSTSTVLNLSNSRITCAGWPPGRNGSANTLASTEPFLRVIAPWMLERKLCTSAIVSEG